MQQKNNRIGLIISNVVSKCISLIYAIYIPISFVLYTYLSITDKGSVLYGYIIDIVRIIVILLFAYNVLYVFRADEKRIKSSKFFIVYAGICLLEFVFTVCMHGKYNYGGNFLLVAYSLFFLVEFLTESLALYVMINKTGGELKDCLFFCNLMVALFLFLKILEINIDINGLGIYIAILFAFAVICILIWQIIRLYYLIRYVVQKN